MTTKQIANKLYALCKDNKFEQAQRELYAQDAESVEPPHTQGFQTVKGLDNIIKKGDTFQSMVEEAYGGYVKKPKVFGNYITMEMGMDVKMKGMDRMKMDEVCIYEVKDGKIVKEQFLF